MSIKKLDTAKSVHENTAIQRQIDATDRQIDELVYELGVYLTLYAGG